jgi:hypothetical protein
MVTRLKKQPTEWEKIFASYTFDKVLIPEFIGKSKTSSSPKESTTQ